MSLFSKRHEVKPRTHIKDLRRVVEIDSAGAEVITWRECIPGDNGFGSAQDWSLDAMLKAGIDPGSMSINTSGSVNRIDSAADLERFVDYANTLDGIETGEDSM